MFILEPNQLSHMPYKDLAKQREAQRKHAAKRYAEGRMHTQKMTQLIAEIKEQGACADCGISYPAWVMDFDHREDEDKLKDVSYLRRHSKATLLAEIEKCDLVCANCHRQRTYQRWQEKKMT